MATKILLADDEKDFLELLTHQLKDQDMRVITAQDGMEALNKARRFLPDVILLDLMLPDLDGLSVCDILRQQPSTAGIPIILVTAMASEMTRLNGLACGANHYLAKPVSVSTLLACIAKALETRSSEVEAHQTQQEMMSGESSRL